jgi:hypothetical protein
LQLLNEEALLATSVTAPSVTMCRPVNGLRAPRPWMAWIETTAWRDAAMVGSAEAPEGESSAIANQSRPRSKVDRNVGMRAMLPRARAGVRGGPSH